MSIYLKTKILYHKLDHFLLLLILVVVLASVFENGKIGILAMASKELVGKGIHCGQIVKEVATLCGGGGGGRPDMAQAGGKDPEKLDAALNAAWSVIEGQIR